MSDDKNKYFKLHGIQLKSVNVTELFIKVKHINEAQTENKTEFTIQSGCSEYDEEKKVIHVGLQFRYGTEEKSDTPFLMRIELSGEFEIDEDQFDKKYVNDWAMKNAPAILFPFLREQAYALSIRCGFPPFILPLIQLPSIQKASSS